MQPHRLFAAAATGCLALAGCLSDTVDDDADAADAGDASDAADGGDGGDVAAADAARPADTGPQDDAAVRTDTGPPPDEPDCTLVVGSSQTRQWFVSPQFEEILPDERWQLLWTGAASLEDWSDAGFRGWRAPLESACRQRQQDPDRVIVVANGEPRTAAQWQSQLAAVVATVRRRFPSVEHLVLQPAVGGPDDGPCSFEGEPVRSAVDHPRIDTAVAALAAADGDVEIGYSPTVPSCDAFRDGLGHLTAAGADAVGQAIARFYAGLGDQVLPPCPADPGGAVERIQDQQYAHYDPAKNRLDSYVPQGPGPWPAIVWIHGGGWQSGTEDDLPQAIRELAGTAYALVSVGYRLSDYPWPAQIADVKASLRWLRAHADQLRIDPARIAVAGSSAGGHLAAMVATSAGAAELDGREPLLPGHSAAAQVAIDLFGPTSLESMDLDAARAGCEGAMCHFCPDSPESKLLDCDPDLSACPDLLAQASPLTWAGAGDPPMLLAHGLDDCTVPPGQSRALRDALVEAGVEATLHEVPGAAHSVGDVLAGVGVRVLRTFLDRHFRRCATP